jgi:putative RNA 2'-phosphotransferase
MEASLVKDSRFLSLVLRHDPGAVGLRLDDAGWVEVDALLRAVSEHRGPMTRQRLDRIVAENDKKRFEFDADGRRIRASQGHSVAVELGYSPRTPPPVLYHGTAKQSVEAIFRDGLLPRSRQQVHLSADTATALRVGSRHGEAVVLTVAAAQMTEQGHEFFLSTNGVWLTGAVPPRFLGRVTA